MDEESIQELGCSDWEDFKAERCYQEHRRVIPEHFVLEIAVEDEQDVNSIPLLLDSIDDKRLFYFLLDTNRKTL